MLACFSVSSDDYYLLKKGVVFRCVYTHVFYVDTDKRCAAEER